MVKRRKVSVFGSTGSIGRNTIKVIKEQGSIEHFEIIALTGHHNVELLAQQAKELRPQIVITTCKEKYVYLKELLVGTDITVGCGKEAVIQAAKEDTHWCMAAIAGAAGVEVAYAALSGTKVLALATKECLVCAGSFFLAKAIQENVNVIPVDSEHNAIFQVLEKPNISSVSKLVLTASGGPFRTWTREQMTNVTAAQALKHPTWNMGKHITIDSATMFNKALEMIEAHWLFDMPASKIDVIVHPESIIHSMIAYSDGSMLAQMGVSDMCIPITYALGWPKRLQNPEPLLNLVECTPLTFEKPDDQKFPALDIARQVIEGFSGQGCVLNAAKEVAVNAFLAKEIGFLGIENCILATLENVNCARNIHQIDEMKNLDKEARLYTKEYIKQKMRT